MAAADVEYRCFVGGLAWATNNETLELAFANFGQVLDSKVCFVSFSLGFNSVASSWCCEARSVLSFNRSAMFWSGSAFARIVRPV